ncbi:MAG: aspartyl aminopeptidase [Clostridia bacterium]|uniref:aminopeptidase n=1 Tax=Petroclostridium xylanilyticum TaxID=1792311 RepID=UPI000B98E176|nr:aminopeptidase [Petroclostridium xylanilyticum]MBZ4645802.1 aspartyl aminopeptidase [Clostridia bacterium]
MSEQEKSQGQKIFDELKYEVKNGWEAVSANENKTILDFSEEYKKFLDKGKTERECIQEAVRLAREKGFTALDEIIKTKKELKKGDKVYAVNRDKAIILAVIGEKSLEEGVNIVGAHMDAPRIDLKQNPIYEDSEMVLLKTHYYGGIKKYQWTTLPLAIHGVVVKKDGQKVNIVIGEEEDDPVFCITDLLPHLAQEQMQKKMSEGITGEGLNVLFGSIPYNDDKVKEKIKLNILSIIHDKYGIKEEDFISAEIEIVPAFKAKDVGLDRGLVGAYGQDDRVCGYTALKAILDLDNPQKTAVCLLVDKEEIGSMGNTGMQSRFFENILAELCELTEGHYNDLMLRRALSNSKCLSADVSAAVDPNYEGVHDKRNAPYISKGVVITKYTGARGKAGSNDAHAEFVGEIRALFNNNNIQWQTGELGKVDQGGGGTIAQFVANLGADVVDCGVALLSMHAPFEIASKLDIYMAYKAYHAFYKTFS